MPTSDRKPRKNTSASTLVRAAVLHLFPGLLHWPDAGISWDMNDIVRIGGTVFLLAMSAWARRSPLIPVVTSAVLYGTYIGMQLYQGTTTSLVPWIIQGAIIFLLVVGLINGVRSVRQVDDSSRNRG